MIAHALRTLFAFGALTVVLLNAGCIAYRPIVTRPPTLGSELISLDEARSAGLLTDDEPKRKEFQITWIAYWLYGCQAADAKDSVAADGEVPLRGPFYIRDPNHAPDQWAESLVVFMVKPTLAK